MEISSTSPHFQRVNVETTHLPIYFNDMLSKILYVLLALVIKNYTCKLDIEIIVRTQFQETI